MSANFAEVFRAELARRGMSQVEASELLGIKQQEASDWARGKRVPSVKRVPTVAKFLRIPPKDLHEILDREADLSRRLGELETEVAGLKEELRRALRARKR